VDKRYSFMSPEEVFSDLSFEARNDIYIREGIKLGAKCLENALEKANWKSQDLDYIITVSCTGIMIPSLDAYLINLLKLRQDIVRLPVTEMGCAAGVSGMIYAKNFLKANPGKRAAVVAVESPSATFQLNDFSMANIVSAAIFGDGAACVLLSSDPKDTGPKIIAEEMYHFYDAEEMMGFKLTNTGLQMVLDVEVPNTIESHFPQIIHPFLAKNNLEIKDIDHLIFHPGGKKIIQLVEELFNKLGKNIDETKAVLKHYGNMSSATVLYVLENYMDKKPAPGEKGLMLSFGPGFSAQRILLQW
ncbi:MAG: type III polyketide synthase, partial [Chryseobacterium sp.]